MVLSRAHCPAFTITTNGKIGILQVVKKILVLVFDITHYSIMQTNILTGLPQKSHPLLDTRSVPPAVAGGCAAV